jgi:hypothetical protein
MKTLAGTPDQNGYIDGYNSAFYTPMVKKKNFYF